MAHSVRTTQPGVLYLTELVDLAATASEAVYQGENEVFSTLAISYSSGLFPPLSENIFKNA